jgi:hypothetical protein
MREQDLRGVSQNLKYVALRKNSGRGGGANPGDGMVPAGFFSAQSDEKLKRRRAAAVRVAVLRGRTSASAKNDNVSRA